MDAGKAAPCTKIQELEIGTYPVLHDKKKGFEPKTIWVSDKVKVEMGYLLFQVNFFDFEILELCLKLVAHEIKLFNFVILVSLVVDNRLHHRALVMITHIQSVLRNNALKY